MPNKDVDELCDLLADADTFEDASEKLIGARYRILPVDMRNLTQTTRWGCKIDLRPIQAHTNYNVYEKKETNNLGGVEGETYTEIVLNPNGGLLGYIPYKEQSSDQNR